MNTLDRIVRIIYRELDLREFINLDRERDKTFEKNLNNINENFRLSSREFKNKVKLNYLEVYSENYNPDEVDIMLDLLEEELNNYGYDNYLSIYPYIANKMMVMNNRKIRIDFEKYLEWHGFMNKVDYNIFYAAFLASNRCIGHRHQSYVLHDNNSIYNRLRSGIAENHMHMKGSGYTTDMNWLELVMEKPYYEKSLKSFLGDNYLDCPKYILAFQKLKLVRLYLYSLITSNKTLINKFKTIDLIRMLEAYDIEELELLYLGKNELYIDELYDDYLNGFVYDIRKRYGKEKQYILSERIFLEKLFRLFLENKLTLFQEYLFNIYILGLNKIKFEFIQDNKEMGFESFKVKEDIKESVIERKGYENLEIYKTVFDNYYSEKYVKLIEFRMAPKNSVKKYIDIIDEIDLANEIVYKKHKKFDPGLEKIEYGLIVHYIKCKKEFNVSNGLMRKEYSMRNLNYLRAVLSKFLDLRDTDLIDYYGEIDFKGSSTYYKNRIVGIDTANYELNFRPEHFGPIYRSHREIDSREVNLNFTYHVGEDFNTIVNGLRAIDEVIEFLGFKRGDRLGHAVALGLNIDDYFNRKRDKLSSTIEEYIDDIAWMYQIISSGDENHTDLLRYLEDEFSKYKNIYLKGTLFQDIDINEYLDSYNLRGDDPEVYVDLLKDKEKYVYSYSDCYEIISNRYGARINQYNDRHKHSFYNKTARDLYFHYHFNSKLKKSGRKVLLFDIDSRYKKSAILCQQLLKKKIYEMELKIETNPSSNKKISSIDKFIELPLLNFNQYGLSNKTTDYDIPVSINTDDSAVFQTNLISEYSFIVAALIREGYNREEIYDYIEYLSLLSLEHSFVKNI